jgi:hypothetical protein
MSAELPIVYIIVRYLLVDKNEGTVMKNLVRVVYLNPEGRDLSDNPVELL